MSNKHRILLIAHGHPDIRPTGGEISAYNLYKELSSRPNTSALFVAANSNTDFCHPGTPFSVRNGNEILFNAISKDNFAFTSSNLYQLHNNFTPLLEEFKPTLVHFHHYFIVGIEMIRVVRNILKNTPIVMTLHEFLAICYNFGKMKKTNGKLCQQSSPFECHSCRPERTPEDYKLRELFIKSFFSDVDRFVSPSNFLIDQYVKWGLPIDKMTLIENGQIIPEHFDTIPTQVTNKLLRFGFFGQINQFKGLEVLLEAYLNIHPKIKRNTRLDIFGSGLENQNPDFNNRIMNLIASDKNIKFHGPYDNSKLAHLMKNIDCVVIPSTWWENSPLVIQEAFKYKIPVLCSNIGGMAEKVIDNFNGIHFEAGDPSSLTKVMETISNDPSVLLRLSGNISTPCSIKQCTDQHLLLYESLYA